MTSTRPPKVIHLTGLSRAGEHTSACTMQVTTVPAFICYYSQTGSVGTTYQFIDPEGRAHEPKQKWPRPWDWFLARKHDKLIRQVYPTVAGVYLLSLTHDIDPDLPQQTFYRYVVFHGGLWYRVEQNSLTAARAGLDYLDYAKHKGNTLFQS